MRCSVYTGIICLKGRKNEVLKRLGRNAGIAVALVVLGLMLTAACGKKSEKDAFAAFAGIWAADTSSYDGLIIDEEGNWEVYKDGGL